MNVSLSQSFSLCREITQREAKHFYYGFLPLPREKREAMFAIYAFMRRSDDLSDEPELTKDPNSFSRWKKQLNEAYEGKVDGDPILPAFAQTVKRYQIPKNYFEELIAGTEMDLSVSRYASFAELYKYCYRVGSVVGLTTLQVLEGDTKQSQEAAEALGIGFQLTNILRDVKEDAARGRIYLPQEDLKRFGVSETQILEGKFDDKLRALMAFEWERANSFYEKAKPLLSMLRESSSRKTISVMTRVYYGLLQKIRERGLDVFRERISLSRPQKWLLAAKGWLCPR